MDGGTIFTVGILLSILLQGMPGKVLPESSLSLIYKRVKQQQYRRGNN